MDPRVSTAHSSGEGGALPDRRGNRKLLQDLYFYDTIQQTYPFQNFLKDLRETSSKKNGSVSEESINQAE